MATSGRDAIVGLVSGVTWHTAVNLAANSGFLPMSLSPISLQGDPIPDLSIANFNEIAEHDVVEHVANPTITCKHRAEGFLWKLWMALFGDDTLTGPVGSVYTHTFNWQQSSAKFLTMGLEVGGADRWEWPSLKVTQCVLQKIGKQAGMVFSTIGDTIKIGADGANGSAQYDAVSWLTKLMIVPWGEWKLRMNAQGGAAVGAGDVISVPDFTLTITRPFEREDVTKGASDGTELMTAEPIQAGSPDIELSFPVGDYDQDSGDESLFDEMNDETEYKADLNLTRSIGGNTHTHLIELPSLFPFPQDADLEGFGRIPLTRRFKAQKPTAAPTGMATANIIHSVGEDTFATSYE